MVQCRNCGAGAPPEAHFCPQCEHVLPLPKQRDFFAFFGVPRTLSFDSTDLEQRFRALSRQFHPDFFYNAPPAERLASLERSSYLNDAYRTLKQPIARIEYLLKLEGLETEDEAGGAGKAGGADEGGGTRGVKVPPALLQEVFALNEELDEIREARERGDDPDALRARLDEAKQPIERKRDAHERDLVTLSARWDETHDRETLEALRARLLERGYLRNLIAAIDKETDLLGVGRT